MAQLRLAYAPSLNLALGVVYLVFVPLTRILDMVSMDMVKSSTAIHQIRSPEMNKGDALCAFTEIRKWDLHPARSLRQPRSNVVGNAFWMN